MWQEDWRKELNERRHAIDVIDLKILELLAKRMELSGGISEIKSKLKLPVCVLEREIEVINTRQDLGRKHGLREKFVKVLFKIIMLESKRVQRELVGVLTNKYNLFG